MPFATTWMDLEIVIRSEVSQTEKDKYNTSYTWNLKKRVEMNLLVRVLKGGQLNWETEINIYTLYNICILYIQYIK